VGSVFGPVRFLFPVCRLCWFLYTLNNIGSFFVAFFSTTIDGRNLIFRHNLHIGTQYCKKCFWTHQIPTSCLPTWLVFIHIDHICGGIVRELMLTVHLVTNEFQPHYPGICSNALMLIVCLKYYSFNLQKKQKKLGWISKYENKWISMPW